MRWQNKGLFYLFNMNLVFRDFFERLQEMAVLDRFPGIADMHDYFNMGKAITQVR